MAQCTAQNELTKNKKNTMNSSTIYQIKRHEPIEQRLPEHTQRQEADDPSTKSYRGKKSEKSLKSTYDLNKKLLK